MVFSKRFIACVKVNGNILRDEIDDTVSLPFGSEWTLYLKNLHSVRAKVKVSVDGKDITEGVDLVIPANGSIDLERFIKSGNMSAGNKLKFIERTSKIEDHRGIGAEDGLVRVEYWLEERKPITQTVTTIHEHVHHYRHPYYYHYPYYGYPLGGGWPGNYSTTTSFNSSNAAPRPSFGQAQGRASESMGMAGSKIGKMTASAPSRSRKSAGTDILRSAQFNTSSAINDAGITVPGGESNQQFTTAGWFPTESQSHVIVIKLRGVVAGKTVKKAVTVKTKPTCETCGTVNKPLAKFCGDCGTALNLI